VWGVGGDAERQDVDGHVKRAKGVSLELDELCYAVIVLECVFACYMRLQQ
jgi:hypothetical protein